MNESLNFVKPELARAMADKCGLAARHMVGVRTIEKWQNTGLISGKRQGRRIFFDVAECDGHLRKVGNTEEKYGNN